MLKRTMAGLSGYQGPIYVPPIRDLNRIISRSAFPPYLIARAGERIADWRGCTAGLITDDGYGWSCTCHIGIGSKETVILIPNQTTGINKEFISLERSVSVNCREKATEKSVIAAVSSFTKALRGLERKRRLAERNLRGLPRPDLDVD